MIYDYLILGGGISGLYSAYHILKKNPSKTILILERSCSLGGRVQTYSDIDMTVDAGAGRFSSKHPLLLELIDELGLKSKIVPISSSSQFMDIHGSSGSSGSSSSVTYELIAKVITSSKKKSKTFLRGLTFLDYASTLLSKTEVEFIKDSFGYYSELVLMNCYDCMNLIQRMGPSTHFYVLSGGLSQIIAGLSKKILEHSGSEILLNTTVFGMNFDAFSGVVSVECSSSGSHQGRTCISALPKQSLEKISWFRPVHGLLKQIKCAPLCRIYCKFPRVFVGLGREKTVWFQGLSKITTNNNLRMILPAGEEKGLIMISYSDNKFADFWKTMFDDRGIRGVEAELARLIQETTGRSMPAPLNTQVFYWSCGVGYWGVGADSSSISKTMVQPVSGVPIYCCSEHFSEKNQQWMEGALDTSRSVLSKIF
jgi:monoamine oxidase